MAENNRPAQSRDPFDRFDEAISDPRLYEADQARYEQLRAQLRYEPQPQYEQPQYEEPQYEQPRYEQPFALSFDRTDVLPEELQPHEPVPLFLSNYEDEPYDQLPGYTFASGSRTKARSFRVVTGVIAVAAIGVILALFSIDSTRAVLFSASFGGAAPPAQFGTAQPESAEPPQRVALAAQFEVLDTLHDAG